MIRRGHKRIEIKNGEDWRYINGVLSSNGESEKLKMVRNRRTGARRGGE